MQAVMLALFAYVQQLVLQLDDKEKQITDQKNLYESRIRGFTLDTENARTQERREYESAIRALRSELTEANNRIKRAPAQFVAYLRSWLQTADSFSVLVNSDGGIKYHIPVKAKLNPRKYQKVTIYIERA